MAKSKAISEFIDFIKFDKIWPFYAFSAAQRTVHFGPRRG